MSTSHYPYSYTELLMFFDCVYVIPDSVGESEIEEFQKSLSEELHLQVGGPLIKIINHRILVDNTCVDYYRIKSFVLDWFTNHR